jgi:ATP-dependent Lon protease
MNPERSERIEIPVLPLRDVVVYPHMVIPLFVGREKSIRCLEAAMDHDKKIMLVAQKEASTDEPGVNDLFTVGTVASILQMLKLPDGTVFLRSLTMANTFLRRRSIWSRRPLMSENRKCWCVLQSASSKATSS